MKQFTISVVGFLLLLFGMGVFIVRSDSIAATVVDFVPAARVNGDTILFSDYRREVEVFVRIWGDDYRVEDAIELAEVRALQKRIEATIVRSHLLEPVPSDVVRSEYEHIVDVSGLSPEAFEEELLSQGWESARDYQEVFVRPQYERTILEQQILTSLTRDIPSLADMRAVLERVIREAQHEDLSREDLIERLSLEGISHQVTEAIWVHPQEADVWMREAYMEASIGAWMKPVRSPIGWHLLYVRDSRDQNGEMEFLVEELFVPESNPFEQWFEEQLREAEVSIYLPRFVWEEGRVISSSK